MPRYPLGGHEKGVFSILLGGAASEYATGRAEPRVGGYPGVIEYFKCFTEPESRQCGPPFAPRSSRDRGVSSQKVPAFASKMGSANRFSETLCYDMRSNWALLSLYRPALFPHAFYEVTQGPSAPVEAVAVHPLLR